MNSSYLFSSSSTSVGAYHDNCMNLSWYSTTDMFPCLRAKNSFFFSFINRAGTWWERKALRNSCQVMGLASVRPKWKESHQSSVAPCSYLEAYKTFSLSSHCAISSWLSIARSQSSAWSGSVECLKTGGCPFRNSPLFYLTWGGAFPFPFPLFFITWAICWSNWVWIIISCSIVIRGGGGKSSPPWLFLLVFTICRYII